MSNEATSVAGSSAASEDRDLSGKYLTFFLSDEEYGLEILKVHEIIGMMKVTPVPRTPDFLRGVINLRGKVIPIVDLRLKFGMPSVESTEQTCIIVVQSRGTEMGVVVDKVSEVADIDAGSIDDTPALGADVNTDFILGIGKTEDGIKLLLDIDRVLSSQEIGEIQAAAGMRG